MLSLNSLSTTNKRGLLSVFGGFLIQLCAGCYHGTFGNLLPYLSSYVRQVTEFVRKEKELKSIHNHEKERIYNINVCAVWNKNATTRPTVADCFKYFGRLIVACNFLSRPI